MRITAVLDNINSENLGLCTEHGLSIWVEYGETSILFDFGCSGAAFYNYGQLAIPLERMNYAVCSHSHYDHAGGLKYFAEAGCLKQLITGPAFFKRKYAFDGIKYTYLGAPFTENLLKGKEIKHVVCSDTLKLQDGLYVMGNFTHAHPMETIPERFVVRETEYSIIPDSFKDEICLVLASELGLVIIVGCSHPGILNIISTVSSRFRKPVYAVIGGTHLMEADEKRIHYTVDEMSGMGVKLLALMHCSGEQAQQIVDRQHKLKSCYFAAGDCIEL